MSGTTVTVSIMGKEYQISCKPEEVQRLKDSARYVDEKMEEIKSGGGVLGLDQLAVMAALNIANDFLGASKETESVVANQETDLASLDGKLSQALTRLRAVAG